jgi:hypothetical protein
MLYHTEIHNMDIVAHPEIVRCLGEVPESMKASFHSWYSERVIDVSDDLPKFSDSPDDFGGSGKMLNSDGSLIEAYDRVKQCVHLSYNTCLEALLLQYV